MRGPAFLITLIFSLITGGCASSDPWESRLMPRLEEGANPNPASMGSDAMMVRKPMPLGDKNVSNDFFFKRCEQSQTSGAFYSKTSYDCNDRP